MNTECTPRTSSVWFTLLVKIAHWTSSIVKPANLHNPWADCWYRFLCCHTIAVWCCLNSISAAVQSVDCVNVILRRQCWLTTAEIRDVQLNTDRRAESRLEWEKWKHGKETEAALERYAREKQRRDAEAVEIAQARAQAVHRAQPVRHYRSVDIHPSSQILTMPESPRFSERLRSTTSRHWSVLMLFMMLSFDAVCAICLRQGCSINRLQNGVISLILLSTV